MNCSHSTDKNVILSEAYRKIIHKIFSDKKQLFCFPFYTLHFEITNDNVGENETIKSIFALPKILFGEYTI